MLTGDQSRISKLANIESDIEEQQSKIAQMQREVQDHELKLEKFEHEMEDGFNTFKVDLSWSDFVLNEMCALL